MDCGFYQKTLFMAYDMERFLQPQVPCEGVHRFKIQTVRTGLEVLELAQQMVPDLILIDITMPDMKGDIICRILKTDVRTRSVPVIILCSEEEKEASRRGLAAGADGLMFKPVSRELLLSTIECYLGIKIRRHNRAEVLLTGTMVLDEKEMATSIHSLSIQGAFLEIVEGEIIVGDLVVLRLLLPGSRTEITIANATVVWLGNYKGDGPYGMGIRFLDVPPESSFLIALYLENTRAGKDHREGVAGEIQEMGSTYDKFLPAFTSKEEI